MLGVDALEDGIGVVDLKQHVSAQRAFRELLEEAVGMGQRQMADFSSCFFAAAGVDQLVVAPESAIDQNEVAGGGRFGPFGVAAGQGRRDEDAFSFLLEDKA